MATPVERSNPLVKALVENEQASYFQRMSRSATQLDFAIKNEDLEHLHRIYEPHRFIPGEHEVTSHPIAAAHQRFAERILQEFAQKHQPVIEICPHLSGHAKIASGKSALVHGCCYPSGRNLSRYLKAASSRWLRSNSDQDYVRCASAVASGVTTERLCLNGYNKCSFQAPFAIANHSLYDISLQKLAAGMHRHGTQVIRAFMHFPVLALVTDNHVDNVEKTQFQVYRKAFRKRIRFGYVNDASFMYDHDYDTWMGYLVHGGLSTPYGFGLLIEKVARHGTSFELRISRTVKNLTVYQCIPSDMLTLIQVPDVFDLMKQGLSRNAKINYIDVDKYKCLRLFNYILARQPKERTPQVALAFARSLVRQIKVGEQIIEEPWEVETDLPRVTASIFLLAELSALRVDTAIARTRAEFKNLTERPSLFRRIFGHNTCVKKFLVAIQDFYYGKGNWEQLPLFNEDSGWDVLARVAFRFHSDIFTKDAVTADGYVQEIDYSSFEVVDAVVETTDADDDECGLVVPSPPPPPPLPPSHRPPPPPPRAPLPHVSHPEVFVNDPPPRPARKAKNMPSLAAVVAAHATPPNVTPTAPPADQTTTATQVTTAPPPPASAQVVVPVALTFTQSSTHVVQADVHPLPAIDEAGESDYANSDTVSLTSTASTASTSSTPSVTSYELPRTTIDVAPPEPTAPLPLDSSDDESTPPLKKKILTDTAFYERRLIKPDQAFDFDSDSEGEIAGFVIPEAWKKVPVLVQHAGPKIEKVSGARHYLSNMCPITFRLNITGLPREFNSVEQAYQFIKCMYSREDVAAMRVYEARDGYAAKKAGCGNTREWEKVRVGIMFHLLFARALQDDDFRDMLDSNTCYIHDVPDRFWGSHSNVFGKLLMTVAQTVDIKPEVADLYRSPVKQSKLATFDLKAEHDRLVAELAKSTNNPDVNANLKAMLTDLLTDITDKGPPGRKHEITGVFGVPGSGKSRYVTSEAFRAKHKRIMYIAPTRALRDAYQAKMRPGDGAFTHHVALHTLISGGMIPDCIVIDEAFMLPMVYHFHCADYAPVVVVGDPHQIGLVDFSQSWGNCSALLGYVDDIPSVKMTQTTRLPQDVLALHLIKTAYPTMTTTSNVTHSVHRVGPTFTKKGAKYIVLTQDKKLQFRNLNPSTVHEVQGGTFEDVVLHIGSTAGERWLIHNSPQHIVTALTRHTQNIYIREEVAGVIDTAMQSAKLDHIMDWTDAAVPDFVDPVQRTYNVQVDPKIERGVKYAPAQSTPDAAREVLDRVLPPAGDVEEYQTVVKDDIPYKGGATGVIRPDVLLEDKACTKKHEVHRFPVPQRVRVSDASHKKQGIQTLFGRYTKRTKNLSEAEAELEANRLLKVIKGYVELRVDDIWKQQVYAEAVEKFQSRNHDLTELADIDSWEEMNTKLVKYLLKQQQKPDLTHDPIHRDKDGQGIAAWGKTLNFAMICWTRLVEKVLMCNAKSNFHFICKYTDEEVLALLDDVARQAREKNWTFFEGDWTEWDSSLNNIEHKFFCKVLQEVGCPRVLYEQYYQMMCRRTVAAPFATLEVKNKKDSGRVDTLVGNTIMNAAAILSFFDKRDVELAMFKGDDSLLAGRRLRINTARAAFYENDVNMKLKPAFHSSAEFVSFIVSPIGASVSLPRLASKVLTRSYTNKDDYMTYQVAVGALLSIRSTEHAARICDVNANHFHSSPEDMDLLLSFMYQFARGQIPFDYTVTFEKRTHDTK